MRFGSWMPWAAMVGACATADADVVTITAGRDNTMWQDPTGSLSNGEGPELFAGVNSSGNIRRALVWFDLGSIPNRATITRVQLRLYCDRARSGSTPMGAHRLLASWGEGQSWTGLGGGSQAMPGDATWIHRYWDTALWTTPGGDFASPASATVTAGAAGQFVTFTGAGMIATMNSWIADRHSNHGWIIKAVNEVTTASAHRFSSREGSTASRRPQLIVEFTPPAPCPADFNADGSIDFFDYDDFVTCFEGSACPPGPPPRSADFNSDGSIDFFDYDDFVLAFETGC